MVTLLWRLVLVIMVIGNKTDKKPFLWLIQVKIVFLFKQCFNTVFHLMDLVTFSHMRFFLMKPALGAIYILIMMRSGLVDSLVMQKMVILLSI